MIEDLNWELALLATVQAFYQRLLGDQLGGELPAPADLSHHAISHATDLRLTLRKMSLWVQLLDMAITPAMLRTGLKPDLDAEVAEALLRHFARQRDDSASHRDKIDLIVTFLYRHPRVPGQWHRRGYGLDGSIPLSPFEIALLEILSESDVPDLPEDHVQLLREFGPLLEQSNRFFDFTALMDSGIISRVRELKTQLGASIYHPGVLATLAPYNASFGERFHILFAAATDELKEFARQLEALGGSILTTSEGIEVTVEHVQALNGPELLQLDYAVALDKFRRVARVKKELERRPPISRPKSTCANHNAAAAAHEFGASAAVGAYSVGALVGAEDEAAAHYVGGNVVAVAYKVGSGEAVPHSDGGNGAANAHSTGGNGAGRAAHHVGAGGAAAAPARENNYVPPTITAQILNAEETKLSRVEESIRVFVRVADPKYRQIVPMRYFNLMLSPHEVEACTADYLDQPTPQADAARTILRMVALTARLTTETEELKRSPKKSSLWNLHADSLWVLLELAKQAPEKLSRLTAVSQFVATSPATAALPSAESSLTAANNPTTDQTTNLLAASLEKLQSRAHQAEKLLNL